MSMVKTRRSPCRRERRRSVRQRRVRSRRTSSPCRRRQTTDRCGTCAQPRALRSHAPASCSAWLSVLRSDQPSKSAAIRNRSSEGVEYKRGRPVLGWFLGLRPRRSAATSPRRRCKCWRIRATAWYTGLATIPAVLVVLVPNPTNSRDMVAFLFYAPGFTGLRGFRNTPIVLQRVVEGQLLIREAAQAGGRLPANSPGTYPPGVSARWARPGALARGPAGRGPHTAPAKVHGSFIVFSCKPPPVLLSW